MQDKPTKDGGTEEGQTTTSTPPGKNCRHSGEHATTRINEALLQSEAYQRNEKTYFTKGVVVIQRSFV